MRALKVLMILLACFAALGVGEEEKTFPIAVQGSYQWSFAFGIGDTEALRLVKLQPWVPSMSQGITADITGKVTEAVSIKARFDSRKPMAFQDFGVYLDSGNWKGVLGNFSLGDDYSFAIPPRTLLGAKLAYLGDGFSVEGVASRSLGKLEVHVFKGQRGEAEALFSLRDPRTPWREAPYDRDLRGLFYFELVEPYVEGLTEVRLRLVPSDGLWGLLESYGLSYLREILEEGAEREIKFTVITDRGKDLLLLLKAPLDSAKRLVDDSIRDYNERHGLSGPEGKHYPFVPGSSVEEEFLRGFVHFIELAVDDNAYPLVEAHRGGYLYLGQGDVIPESLELSVKLPGEGDFVPLPEGFSYGLFPREGVLRIEFPEWFFSREDTALRARFQYRAKRDIFFLSPLMGIVRGSEKVYRNGKLLKRGQDYSIDYEIGTLQLFTPLKEGEELRVEFEIPHGLGTGPQEDLLGLSLSFGEGAKLFLFRSAEVMEITPTTPTMPNEHTVAGLLLSGKGEGWSYSLVLGGSVNVFPPGKNERIPGPNRVTAIGAAVVPDGTYIVFSHLRGISVYKDGAFRSYRSGNRVHDLLPLEGVLLLAERGALVSVHLSRPSPFDWRESYTELPLKGGGISGLGRDVLALGSDGEWIYAATEKGIIRFPQGDLSELPEILSDPGRKDEWLREHWVLWVRFPPEAGHPTSLAPFSGRVYVGTEAGLWECQGDSCSQVGVEGPVYGFLALEGGPPGLPRGLYVASAEGLFVYDGFSLERLARDRRVFSLLVHDGRLFYGGDGGLFVYGEEDPVLELGAPITALEGDGEAVWIGTQATPREGKPNELIVYRFIPETGHIEEFPKELNRILPTDPGTFRDIPREGNTDRGLMARFSWNESVEDGHIGWYIRINTPGYEPIDRSPPAEGHGIGFSLSKRYDTLSLGLRGDLGIRASSPTPVSDLSGRISLGWKDVKGTGIDISLSPFLKGIGTGSRSSGLGYSLDLSWKRPEDLEDKGLLQAVNLSARGGLRAEGSGGTAEVAAVLGPFGPFKLELRGKRPYLFGGSLRGEEAWGLTLSGTPSITGVGLGVRWEESWRRAMGPHVEEGWRYARSISLVPKLGSWSLGDWKIRPSFVLSGKQDAAETRISLKGSPSLEAPGEPSPRLTLGFELGHRLVHRTHDTVWSLRLSPRLTLTSVGLGSLELSARGSWELFLRGSGRTTSRFSLDHITLSLAPHLEGWKPKFLLEYTLREISLSLQRTEFRWEWISFELSGRLAWDLGRRRLRGEIQVTGIRQELFEDWDMSLEGGYLFSLDPRGFKQGIYSKLNLTLDFSF